jgi:DNA-binding TFAR19-related protein (PDSD5 family)
MPDPKTEEMRLEQLQKERSERSQARDSTEDAEEETHKRRAQRAAYLKEKLDERARSEDESG